MTEAPTAMKEATEKAPRALDLSLNPEEARIMLRSGDTPRASWPYSLDDVKSNNHHLSDAGRNALVAAFLWCIDAKHPVRMEDFADRVGYQRDTLHRMYRGKYMGAGSKLLDVPTKLVSEIHKFLDRERSKFGGKAEFVKTPTAMKIWRACNLAKESQSPVFVIGPSHIGKTWALETYRNENDHDKTIYCRMDAASGLGGMVRKLARSMGVSDNGNTANLKSYIKNALTSDMVVLVDEVHLLQYTYRTQSFFACMEVLRELYDEAHCGFVFCGTRLFLKKLEAGAHGEMEQLMRRGVHRCILPMAPTRGDMEAIFAHWDMAFPARNDLVSYVVGKSTFRGKPWDVLRSLAQKQGLKAIMERLRYGRKLAAKDQEDTPSMSHFLKAHHLIGCEADEDEEAGWK